MKVGTYGIRRKDDRRDGNRFDEKKQEKGTFDR